MALTKASVQIFLKAKKNSLCFVTIELKVKTIHGYNSLHFVFTDSHNIFLLFSQQL